MLERWKSVSIEASTDQTTNRFRPAGWVWAAAVVAMVLGTSATVVGFASGNRLETWTWLIVWFVLFGGIAQGMLCWAAVFRVSQATWTPAINRIGHSALAYLPVSFAVMVLLLAGVREWAPWVAHPIPEKSAWLNVPFMVIRDVVLVGMLIALDFLLVRFTLIADEKARLGEAASGHEQWRLTAIGTAVVFGYVYTFSVISYDFIMSLAPEWYSTMFAPYYWVTSIYAAMAMLVILSAILRKRLGVVRYISEKQFNDMGNLMLGFSLFSMGLFFGQYLTIWYGNLPDETFFLIDRYYRGHWPYLGWTSFFLGYAIPFLLLQSRSLKHNPVLLSVTSAVLLVGVALERYVLVVPSMIGTARIGLAIVPGFSVLFFIGAFTLGVVAFLGRYPAVSSAEAALAERQKLEVIS